MTKTSTWKQIASDLDAERSYLLRRCLKAEGKAGRPGGHGGPPRGR